MKNPIKVVQSLASAEKGGAENFYTRLVCALTQYPEIQQYAFTRPWPGRVAQLQAAGVPVQTFKFGGPLAWRDRSKYRKALQALQPDVVLSYMNRATFATPAGDYRLAARLGHFYNLKYYRHCDFWIGNSRGICDHIVRGGMPATKVFYIPNFSDEAPVDPLPRDSFNTPIDRPLVLSGGRLHVNKAFDTLLRAFRDVPEATLWLAGDGPERRKLQSLCRSLGLEDRVRFLGWRNDLNALMRTADVFVCPSRHEGLGGIVLEAWLHGCPIVATRSQGPAELIKDTVTGLLTPIDQTSALADAIRQLLDNPQRARQLAENASRQYAQHFSKQTICRQYVDFFQHVCSQ